MREVALVYPGELATRTGGYIYDRRAFAALEERGWAVRHVSLPTSFPAPDAAALATAHAALAGLPDGSSAVIDGLALGAMPEVAARHRERLDLIGLVHHPLCLETGLDPGRAARLRESERAALAAMRHVVVTSRTTAATLATELDVAPPRITVALPGVDPAPLAPGGSGRPRLLCIGTLIPRKGHLLLVEALAGLRALDWDLACVGSLSRDPATAAAVREAIARHRLGDRVRLTGELEGPALEAELACADLVVSASYYEGYGMALAEALARGLPVVATAGGAVAETVPGDAGLLVEPGDTLALRAALRRAVGEPALRAALREGARRARGALPGWDDTARAIESVLPGTRSR